MTWDFTIAGTSVKTLATIASYDGILSQGAYRGADLVVPTKRGQTFNPKPLDAYSYPVPLTLLGTSQGQLQDNLDALKALCVCEFGAKTFGRTIPRSAGDLTSSHTGTGSLEVAMVNGLVTGRVNLTITNLDGCWYGASASPTIPATITVAGTARTNRMTLVLPAAGTLTNTTLGVSVTVTAGMTLTVQDRTTTGALSAITHAGDPLGNWFTLAPGSNVITWSGSGTPTITYYPAYL